MVFIALPVFPNGLVGGFSFTGFGSCWFSGIIGRSFGCWNFGGLSQELVVLLDLDIVFS